MILVRKSPLAILAVCYLCVTLLAGSASAQQQDTGTGTGTGTGQGGDGTVFQPEDVDTSAFTIERGESIGTSDNQGFGLGADTNAGGGARGGVGGGGGGFGALGGLGGLFGGLGGAFGGGQGAASSKPMIRVRIRSAIQLEPRSSSDLQRVAQNRLAKSPPRSGVQGVNVTMVGNTAVLTGQVATERQRRMSELLMRLEPGVSVIENRVEVAQQ